MSTCAFIKLDPVMDIGKASQLEKEFEKMVLDGKKKIYLDLSDVGFLCSYMMRVLIKFHKTWRRAGVRIGIKDTNDYSKNTLKWREECDLKEKSSDC
jgi:anti-anti-sigma regulatory factor